MATSPRGFVWFSEEDNELLKQALANCERREDGAVDEQKVIKEVKRLQPFDVEKERHKKAVRFVQDRKKPAKTEPDGQLVFPGFGSCAYEPLRLIDDGAGHVVEQMLASPEFKQAALEREKENLDKINRAYERDKAFQDRYRDWAQETISSGRSAPEDAMMRMKDTTGTTPAPGQVWFDWFVHEEGYWHEEE